MHTFASPKRGYCASCDGVITNQPVYRMDEAYCCIGCAQNGPCICTYEQDLADDGVNNLGLPFPMEQPVVAGTPSVSADRVGQEVSVR